MLKFLIVIFCVIGAIAIYGDYIFSENVNDEFLSRITLSTNCEVEINSFGLKNLNTQEVTPFNHGEAFIRAKTGDELQVVMSPQISGIILSGEKVEAAPNVKVFQDCNKRVTLETIFDSMNNQFGTKENN
jgi:hypothetical protein